MGGLVGGWFVGLVWGWLLGVWLFLVRVILLSPTVLAIHMRAPSYLETNRNSMHKPIGGRSTMAIPAGQWLFSLRGVGTV